MDIGLANKSRKKSYQVSFKILFCMVIILMASCQEGRLGSLSSTSNNSELKNEEQDDLKKDPSKIPDNQDKIVTPTTTTTTTASTTTTSTTVTTSTIVTTSTTTTTTATIINTTTTTSTTTTTAIITTTTTTTTTTTQIPYSCSYPPKADILFSLDISPSMSRYLPRLGGQFSTLLTGLECIDWQMAFINADSERRASQDGNAGLFYNLENVDGEIRLNGNEVRVLKPELQQHFNLEQVFQYTVVRSDTDGIIEGPNESIIKAVNMHDTQNTGFFRDDAALIAIIFADEDEHNWNISAEPSDVIAAVNNAFGSSKKFIVHGIINVPLDTPEHLQCFSEAMSGEKFSHYKYKRVYNLILNTGGVAVNICKSDYTSILQDITSSIKSSFGL